nr:HD domain-containing protein [uncultured Desulfobulbus sp.]
MTFHVDPRQIEVLLPPWLKRHLRDIHSHLGGELYLAGGVVRDLLLGKPPQDIDLCVNREARSWAENLAARSGGALVPLGREEDAARVVSRGLTVDFSSFRRGAATIVEDLRLRDLSINAMALRLDNLLHREGESPKSALVLIDPTLGRADLENGVIRAAGPQSFIDDPLRLLRAFRFAASLGFSIDAQSVGWIRQFGDLIVRPAPERIAHELDLIMDSGHSAGTMSQMATTGLLWALIPELAAGVEMEQPASHHLDVFGHSLEALAQMERILENPRLWFPRNNESLLVSLQQPAMHRLLCWAALMHDLGKPPTYARRVEKDNRITFYHHDHVGARVFATYAQRFRWSNEDRELVSRLISHHMRPFFLANVARDGHLTLRACIRLLRKAGDILPGLFLLAMADSLAGQGEARVVDMEQELGDLYAHLEQVRLDHVAPVKSAKPLINGHDLIKELHLQPSPIFKSILGAVEEAHMEGLVATRSEALTLAKTVAAQKGP